MKKMLVLLLSGVILSGVSVVSAQVLEVQKGDYYDAVKLLYVDKNFNEALNKVNALLEQTPDSAELYSLRAQIYEDMENKRAALADFDKSAELDPKNDETFYYRAALKLDMNSPQAAYVDSTKCIHLNPNNSACYILRSTVRAHLGDSAGASADMSRARDAQRNAHNSQKSVSK
jgi:tetratricopeptide (TPR) repeat protein